jgi:hypothetical protein
MQKWKKIYLYKIQTNVGICFVVKRNGDNWFFLKDQDDVNEQIILILNQLLPDNLLLIVSLIQLYIDQFSFVIILNNLRDIFEQSYANLIVLFWEYYSWNKTNIILYVDGINLNLLVKLYVANLDHNRFNINNEFDQHKTVHQLF